ncbi:MAG: lipopolysaccharide assembly protein LapA domain-containing protein [Acidimicrobiales bacterium]|jgi:uncharacterized integral membrane protein|nr:lipopolysaccharide assembly protein LapA domain-containing protein [Acidimicrobiales bacterium]
MTDGSGRSKGIVVTPRIAVGGGLAVVGLAFVLLNRDDVQIDFGLFDATVSLWVALLLTFLLGLAAGVLVMGGRSKSRSKKG